MSIKRPITAASFIVCAIIACSGDKSTPLAARGAPCLSVDECFPGELCENSVCVGVCNVRTDCATGERCENARCIVVVACGNNAVDAGEDCDDGNEVRGDGCSPECEFDPKYTAWANTDVGCDNQCGSGKRPQERQCVQSDGQVLACEACGSGKCSQQDDCVGHQYCQWGLRDKCQRSATDARDYTCGENGYAPLFCYNDINNNKQFDATTETTVGASLCTREPPSQVCVATAGCAYSNYTPPNCGPSQNTRTFTHICQAPDKTEVSCKLCGEEADTCAPITCQCGTPNKCPP